MARKSRMRQPAPVRSAGKSDMKVYKTALYARLSAEREDTRERGTIQNQINFIRHYVEQQEDMEIYDTYMDDDISGTRFDRPAFERMMLDMRNGRIDCIVVKEDCVIIELNQKALENRDFVMWFCFFDPKTDTFYTLLAQGGGARRVERPQQHS